MKIHTKDMRKLCRAAVSDAGLAKTLTKAAKHFGNKRAESILAFDRREEFRNRARDVRKRSLANLPALLEELEANVIKAGGQVHWAPTAEDAGRAILDIAARRQAKVVVKGKSILSEEIDLNTVMQNAGLEVWETDLGEYIVQLAEQGPSHILAPCIHMSRQDIQQLFARKLGEHGETGEELTAIARRLLREQFLRADMSVTGVNMAVASTGSVILVENEGNIRMSTTCPPVHVALMSLEKVVADLDEAGDILSMLPRAATGQTLSSYITLFTGPRRQDETDGPEEFHLVILDNGRHRILADPVLRDSLHCIRCGSCLNVCPVYESVGGFSYGWAYSGPMGCMLVPQLLNPGQAPDHPYACTQCGACAEACPVRIDIPNLLLELRRKMNEDPAWSQSKPRLTERAATRAFGFWAATPGRFKLAAALSKPFRNLNRFAKNRKLPVPAKTFSQLWPSLADKERPNE